MNGHRQSFTRIQIEEIVA
ncbi:MAG: bL21 family ribosomal protein [Marinilabiliales bacterium]|nr:bL21 family ribosomal protein [Marinilabiliales bacterium]